MMLAEVKRLLYDLPLQDLLKCKDILKGATDAAYVKHKEKVLGSNIDEFVEYTEKYIAPNSVNFADLEAELATLNITGKKNKTSKCWLTTTGLSYSWKSGSKTITNKPVDISQSRCINNIMLNLNKKYDIELNSCLVTYYHDGSNGLRLHHDGEPDMDSNQPICLLSVGAVRTVDFLHKYQHFEDEPLLSLNPASGSLYIMNPGCQDLFRHRVAADNSVKKGRYALSFRRRVLPEEVKVNRSFGAPPNLPDSFANEPSIPGLVDSNVVKSNRSEHNHVIGKPKVKRTTVIFGTSITSDVKGSRLAHRGRRCINISRSGAKISDISDMVDDFRMNDPDASDIEKVIFSFGTNDIKSERKAMEKFRQPITDLFNKTKEYFPGCIIYVQPVLPIGRKHWFTAPNVLDFNVLLREVCGYTYCPYINCFRDFVLNDGSDHDHNLFRDWLHLNKRGVGTLCLWFKYVINNYVFDPIIN